MRGTEYRDALAAIDRVLTLKQARSETVRRALHSTLAYLGATRLYRAVLNDPEAAEERRLLGMCAKIETLADGLDHIPQRAETMEARRAAWADIVEHVGGLRARVAIDRRMTRERRASA
jgi:hypothetical protein